MNSLPPCDTKVHSEMLMRTAWWLLTKLLPSAKFIRNLWLTKGKKSGFQFQTRTGTVIFTTTSLSALRSPHSLLSKGYQGIFPWNFYRRKVSLTALLHIAPQLRMHGALPTRPLKPYACLYGIRTNLPLPFKCQIENDCLHNVANFRELKVNNKRWNVTQNCKKI
jgi:hypothetical protein